MLQNKSLRFFFLTVLCSQLARGKSLPLNALSKDEFWCESCRLFVDSLNLLWGSDVSQDCVAELVTAVCIKLKIEAEFICKLMISEFKHEVLYVLGQVVLQPRQICGLILPDCGDPFNPWNGNWTIEIPANKPPVQKIVQPKIGSRPTLRVLHLTDIHFDPYYRIGAEANCTIPECCRVMPPKGQKANIPAGQWGTISDTCDVPLWTVETLLKNLSKTDKFDFIYWTGDLPPHDDWNYNKPRTRMMLQNLTDLFLKYFPKTPVYSAVGNHEGVPIDSFPPHYVPEEYGSAWLYDMLAKQWNNWLPNTTTEGIKWRASYSFKPYKGMRIISVNTMYGYRSNFWIYINQTDPDGTLAWLAEQLLEAEKSAEKVHIIGHIPSGQGGMLSGWASNYYKIINRFENIIRAQIFGHQHHDIFHMYYEGMDYRNRPTNLVYVGPSMTTRGFAQPAYRVYTVDGDYPNSTWTVLDHETHYMDVEKSNKIGTPQWNFEYSVRAAYNMSSLLAADWNDFINRMEMNRTLFDLFLWHYGRNTPPACDEECRRKYICECRTALTKNSGKNLCPKSEIKTPPSRRKFQSERWKNESLKRKSLSKLYDKCPI